MKKVLLLLSSFLFIAPLAIQAQCGMTPEQIQILNIRTLRNKAISENMPAETRNDIKYVPVTFHLIAKGDKTGRIDEHWVLQTLCDMNANYLDQNIQFYIKKLNYINSTNAYDNPSGSTTTLNFHRDLGALNIYLANKVDANTTDGETLAYYDPTRDWIVCKNDQFQPTNKAATISHEVGHFFSLAHTFNGWEAGGYVDGTCAPATSPGGVPTENADGSNCNTAGDFLCDTPADYNLGFGWTGCTYNGNAKDPNCLLLSANNAPDEKNYMGYFLACSPYHFSDQQKSLIHTDLYTNGDHQYVNPGTIPDLTEITQAPVLNSPSDVTIGYNSVAFDWNDVPGAAWYLLETAWNSTFIVSPQRYLVNQSGAFIVGDFDQNKTYYWRVTPFGPYRTCTSPSAPKTFKTNSTVNSINDLNQISDVTVQPNPVQVGQNATLDLVALVPLHASIRLFDITGRVLSSDSKDFQAGESQVELNTGNLSAGIYLVTMETGQQKITEKIIIAN